MTHEEIQQGYNDHFKHNIDMGSTRPCDLTEEGWFQGARWAEQQLVHEPNNPEGITATELAHQIYGTKFGKQEIIDKACQYLRDHIDPKLTIYHERTWMSLATFIGKFRKAMEE